ncbi:MAG: cytochrome c biogenesis CcdA family protein [Spirochaetaceae bacterium]
MVIITFFAFLSGVITILSPCILPVLPIVLSGSIGGKSKPLGVISGFILSFSIFTLTLSAIVKAFNISPNSMRIVAIIIIIAFGLTLVIPKLQLYFEILVSRFIKQRPTKQKSGFFGGFMVGTSLGLIWTPCVGPIMASVIGLAISQNVDGGAVVIIIAYALGTSLPMLGIMIGGRKLLNKFPKLMGNTQKIQRFFGILMIVVGLSIGFGLDRKFQGFILQVFPNYGASITAIEENDLIQKALDERSGY